MNHLPIEPRLTGIFIKGKDKHFNRILPNTFDGEPHSLTFKQRDKYVQSPDFGKSLARS